MEWNFNLEKTAGKETLKDPYGFKVDTTDVAVRASQRLNVTQQEVYEKNAWNFAKSPTSQLPMFLFMMWMTGSSLSIYTIMFTMNFALAPFKAIFNVNQAFEQFEFKGVSLTMPKLLYIGCNLITVGLASYKFSKMGIIPVLCSDWAGLFAPRLPLESSQVILT